MSEKNEIESKYHEDKKTGCWEWTGDIEPRTKMPIITGGFVGMILYEKAHGKLPKNTLVLPECRNPLCVNPDHEKKTTVQEFEELAKKIK